MCLPGESRTGNSWSLRWVAKWYALFALCCSLCFCRGVRGHRVMNRLPRTILQKQREQHNANRAYPFAPTVKNTNFLGWTLREDTSTYIFCFPLEQSLARTTDSGRVVRRFGSNPVGHRADKSRESACRK